MDVVLTFCASWTKSVPPESHVTTIGLSLTSHISNFPSNRNMQYVFFLLFNLYVVVCHSLKWDIYTLCIIICVFFRAILLQILLTEKVRFIRVFILNFEHGLNETIDVTWQFLSNVRDFRTSSSMTFLRVVIRRELIFIPQAYNSVSFTITIFRVCFQSRFLLTKQKIWRNSELHLHCNRF